MISIQLSVAQIAGLVAALVAIYLIAIFVESQVPR